MRIRQRQFARLLPTCGRVLVFCGAVVIAYGQIQRAHPIDRSGDYKIAGVVVSEAGGAPLAGARITIVDTGYPLTRQSVLTPEGGHFVLHQLRAGKYTLQGDRRGFCPHFSNLPQQCS